MVTKNHDPDHDVQTIFNMSINYISIKKATRENGWP